MRRATEVIRLRPDTMTRFQKYVGSNETANTALSNMINIIDELSEDMGY